MDDDSMLTDNPLVQSAHGLEDIWFSTKLPDYYPLTLTSMWLEWRLWGMNAMGYHITNVLLHIFSAVLWWRILKSLAIPGAWLAALIFAVHPVNVESVVWIAQRKNTLAMLFYAVALWGYLRFETEQKQMTNGSFKHSGWRWYGLSLLAFLFALWSKTSVVMFPVVILLCAWWRRGGIVWRDLRRSAPFFGLALIWGLVTVWFQYHSAGAGADVATRSFGARLAGAGMAAWFYLWKAIWPTKLAFVYPQWEINAGSPLVYLPVAAWILCFGVFWRWWGGWGKPLLFGLGYFVVTLLPVLGFLKIYFHRYSLVADHWQYFSIIGVVALMVGAGNRYLATNGKFMLVGRGIGVLVVGALCFLTWQQCRIYGDAETLWRDTLAKNPTCWLAHNNLGVILGEHALRIKPDSPEAHDNLGTVSVRAGLVQEGIAHMMEAVRINPDYDLAYYNLAFVLLETGKFEEAVGCYEQVLRINPDSLEAHNRLAGVLARLGRMPEAMAEWERVLELDPNFADAHNNLGMALMQTGRLAEAVPHFEEAVRIKPDYAKAYDNLARLLATLARAEGGDPVRAIDLAHRACNLTDNQAARYVDTLAMAYAAAGRFDDAMAADQRAMDLARAAGQSPLARQIEQRLELYRTGHASRPSLNGTNSQHP